MALFRKAVKSRAKARVGIIGPSGSGKTYTALKIASGLGGKIAVIDTEFGSASKYAQEFDFDVCELTNYDPRNYIDAIKVAGDAGYDVIIIDSLSHAWASEGGVLDMVEKLKAKYKGNKWAAWNEVTPIQNQLTNAMLRSPAHIIATLRSKMDYVQTKDEKGSTVIRKVGMAPIQREGLEYEFDVIGDMDLAHNWVISKTRCHALDNAVIPKPGEDVAQVLNEWLSDGADPQPLVQTPARPVPTSQQQQPPRAEAPPAYKKNNNGALSGMSTAKQQGKIHAEAEKKRYKADVLVRKRFGIKSGSTKDLTKQQASDLISWLIEAPPAEADGQQAIGGMDDVPEREPGDDDWPPVPDEPPPF